MSVIYQLTFWHCAHKFYKLPWFLKSGPVEDNYEMFGLKCSIAGSRDTGSDNGGQTQITCRSFGTVDMDLRIMEEITWMDKVRSAG